MKLLSQITDPFTLVAFAVILSAAYTYYDTFLDRSFEIFTSEEEIAESIENELPLFVEYL